MEANPALKLPQSWTLAEYCVDWCCGETLGAVSQFFALLQGSGPSSHPSVVPPDKSYQIITFVTVTFLLTGYPLLVTLAFHLILIRFPPVLPRHTLYSSSLPLVLSTYHGHCWVHLSAHVVTAIWSTYLELTFEIPLNVTCSLRPAITILDCADLLLLVILLYLFASECLLCAKCEPWRQPKDTLATNLAAQSLAQASKHAQKYSDVW